MNIKFKLFSCCVLCDTGTSHLLFIDNLIVCKVAVAVIVLSALQYHHDVPFVFVYARLARHNTPKDNDCYDFMQKRGHKESLITSSFTLKGHASLKKKKHVKIFLFSKTDAF